MTAISTTTVSGKAFWRDTMRVRRKSLDHTWAFSASEKIADRVKEILEFKEARVILCYWAMAEEVQTDLLIQAAWVLGKRVCVPATAPDRDYFPAWCDATTPLNKRRWGIREPVVPHPVKGLPVDLALVPGVAFDRMGARVGHGAGYFDRLLSLPECKGAFTIGLAFDFQVVSQPISVQPHDVAMQAVATEKEFIRCPQQGGSTGDKQK